jgi:acyl-CoA synthetase (AMP-forming)/AMP-acid ligase II
MWAFVWPAVWLVCGSSQARTYTQAMSSTAVMNIGSYLTRAAEQVPDRLAVACGNYRASYAEEERRVNALAIALKSLGLRQGDRAAILQWNCPQFLETMLACFKAGFCVVPINARLHPEEVRYHLQDCEAGAVIYGAEFGDAIACIRESLPTTRHFISIDARSSCELDFESLVRDHATTIDQTVRVESDDLAWLFYTSGTTGRPKGAMLTYGNLDYAITSLLADVLPIDYRDAALHAAPLSHGSGFQALTNVAKAAANVILFPRHFEPTNVFETIERYRVTNIFLAPTMIKLLVDAPEIEKYDLSSLRHIVYGGGPMYVDDLKIALGRLGPLFVQIYAQGETPMTGTYLRREDHVTHGSEEQESRLMSAGVARTGVEVRILDAEDGEGARGELGEIVVRGPSVMKGYWRQPDATADTLRNGWLHTGDVGYMDSSGYVFILDRKKDMIISGGANIYPREIEEVIQQHPAVKEVAVVGVPDELWGESVRAVVALHDGYSVTEHDIVSECLGHLASYKKPTSVEFVPELPKNANGKILKRELRDRYWLARDRKV